MIWKMSIMYIRTQVYNPQMDDGRQILSVVCCLFNPLSFFEDSGGLCHNHEEVI